MKRMKLFENFSTDENKVIVMYVDCCKEIIDAITHKMSEDTQINGFSDIMGYFVSDKDILLPSWIKNSTALEDLLKIGYVIQRSNGEWGLTQKGFDFACSLSFHFADDCYHLKIYNKTIVDKFLLDIYSL